MADQTVVVEGLADLQRAFARIDRDMSKRLRAELKATAEPVKQDAERLAAAGIPRIGIRWSRMRVGVTQREVYVVPRERGAKSKARAQYRRPNLKGLLLDRSFDPALAINADRIEDRVDDLLGRMSREWGQGG